MLFIGSLDRLGRKVETIASVAETLCDADVKAYPAANGKVPVPASPLAASLLAVATSYEEARAAIITR